MAGILITPRPFYLLDQSNPEEAQYAFGYEITIYNQNHHQVQLLDRHWYITDANGQDTEIQGTGVVGQQPVLAPDDSYTYKSGVLLKTPFGYMRGSYTFHNHETDQMFEVEIPAFALAIPNLIN